MRKNFLYFFLFFVLISSSGRSNDFDDFKIDTFRADVFKDAGFANFKIDYFRTDGYSTHDRYWYEVLVLDSLLILNFHSPANDDWNFIDYQKQEILDEDTLADLQLFLDSLGLYQKKAGIPVATFSGYGADRLYIETDNIKIAGGTVSADVGDGDNYEEESLMQSRVSSTIGGNYEALFKKLTGLFKLLDQLMDDKDAFEHE